MFMLFTYLKKFFVYVDLILLMLTICFSSFSISEAQDQFYFHCPTVLLWSGLWLCPVHVSFFFFFFVISSSFSFKLVRCFFSRFSFLYLSNFMDVQFFFMHGLFSKVFICYSLISTLVFYLFTCNNLLSIVLFDDIKYDCTWQSTCPINCSTQILLVGQDEHFKSKI